MSVMIVECPHCYTNVIPTPQGQCPACRKNVYDSPHTDPSKTSLTVRHMAQLPAACCQCGCNTDRHVKVTRNISHEKGPDAEPEIFLILGVLINIWFWLLALLFGAYRSRISDVVVVRMPQCDHCSENGPPDPIRVNSEELNMTFVVHKDFKRLVLKGTDRAVQKRCNMIRA